MKIFEIDVSKKKNGFNKLYETLEKAGNFIVCPSKFILLSKVDELSTDITEDACVSIKEIKDIEIEVTDENVKNWLYTAIAKNEIDNSRVEIQERTNAMYDILVETEKKLKGDAIKNGNKTNVQKQKASVQKTTKSSI